MEENLKSKIEEVQITSPKTSVMQKIFFNVLGFVAGYCAGAITFEVSKWLFFDVLGQIKFLRSILSYPVDYGVYAITGITSVDALVSLYICGTISKIGKAKRNYSCYVLATIRILSYIISLISTIRTNGFNFEIVWTIIISLGAFLIIMNATANNKNLENI